MATAKKAAPKVAVTKKVSAPAKAVKPVTKAAPKKAAVSKTAKAIAKISASIAKLTERKNKLGTEINALRDQRAALKVVAAPAAAPVVAKAKAAPKVRAPAVNICRQLLHRVCVRCLQMREVFLLCLSAGTLLLGLFTPYALGDFLNRSPAHQKIAIRVVKCRGINRC